jgi:phytanoyl-CoA hydroxylase
VTPAERVRYRDDGFIVLRGFVVPRRCDELRARAAELVAAFEPGARRSVFTTDDQARRTDGYFLDSGEAIHFFFEDEADGVDAPVKERAINKIGHALHDLDPVFDAFSRSSALAALVGALGVADPRLVQSMYIFKPPFIGGAVRVHQDATFLHTEPESVVGLWFALEEAREDNGCLWAIPGGHRAGLRSRFVREGRTTRMETLDATPWDEAAAIPLEVAKGDVIVLDGLVPHLSRANRSPASREAYTLHVAPAASAFPSTNWLRRVTPPRGFR